MSVTIFIQLCLTLGFATVWVTAQKAMSRDGASDCAAAFTLKRMLLMTAMLAGLTGSLGGGLDIARTLVWGLA